VLGDWAIWVPGTKPPLTAPEDWLLFEFFLCTTWFDKFTTFMLLPLALVVDF